ncbi:MAG TPA: hypothetical protein VFV64_05865 [Permianibacter sp.]|nr:hypothetical protein [Permianibacter sp.]
MTRIDPSRIAAIFQQLRAEKTDSPRPVSRGADKSGQPVAEAAAGQRRDPENLRHNLRLRLARLQGENGNFAELAPEIAVREVLVWEFGDEVLNHPDFHQVAASVTRTIQANSKVNAELQKLIRQLTR